MAKGQEGVMAELGFNMSGACLINISGSSSMI